MNGYYTESVDFLIFETKTEKAKNDYIYDSIKINNKSLLDDADKSDSKFKKFIDNIIEAIKELFDKIKDKMSKLFSKEDEAIIKTSNKSFTPSMDFDKVKKDLDKKINDGEKLLDDIASGKAYDKNKVAIYSNMVYDTVKYAVIPAVTVGTAYTIYLKYEDKDETKRNIFSKKLASVKKQNLSNDQERDCISVLNTVLSLLNISRDVNYRYAKEIKKCTERG